MKLVHNICVILMASALFSTACRQIEPEESQLPNDLADDAILMFTKGDGPLPDKVETYRVSDIYNGTSMDLCADGSYCGYYDRSKGWLYPCLCDDEGNALDSEGNVIAWDDAQWFQKTLNDTEYGLRMRPLLQESYATMVICSPARRMQKYRTDSGHEGEEVSYGSNPKGASIRWGYYLDCEDEFYISKPVEGKTFKYSSFDNQYIYSMPFKLQDKRAKVSVIVACGALEAAYLNKVHFENVITQCWYQPKAQTYEYPIYDNAEEDPFLSFTSNSYPTGASEHTGSGNVLFVPEDEEDIHLLQRPGKTGDFTEWSKSSNTGTAVTAIHDFPIFSLDYGKMSGDKYVYEEQIPKIVINYGSDGSVQSTIRLASNIEPMKNYVVIVYISTATVSAELYVVDWNQEADISDMSFGEYVPVPLVCDDGMIAEWDAHTPSADEGLIENPDLN